MTYILKCHLILPTSLIFFSCSQNMCTCQFQLRFYKVWRVRLKLCWRSGNKHILWIHLRGNCSGWVPFLKCNSVQSHGCRYFHATVFKGILPYSKIMGVLFISRQKTTEHNYFIWCPLLFSTDHTAMARTKHYGQWVTVGKSWGLELSQNVSKGFSFPQKIDEVFPFLITAALETGGQFAEFSPNIFHYW